MINDLLKADPAAVDAFVSRQPPGQRSALRAAAKRLIDMAQTVALRDPEAFLSFKTPQEAVPVPAQPFKASLEALIQGDDKAASSSLAELSLPEAVSLMKLAFALSMAADRQHADSLLVVPVSDVAPAPEPIAPAP